MLVLLYRPHLWSRPTGIAWWDASDDTVRCAFTEPGDQILAMDELVGASNRLQFETKARKLSGRTPATSAWESAAISISPQEYLAILQRSKSA